jgi:hypothetical protein
MATLAAHLLLSSPSKGLRAYNSWATKFGQPTCNMAAYLARSDVQSAYPRTISTATASLNENLDTAAQLRAVIEQAQNLLSQISGEAVVEVPFTRSTPRKAAKVAAKPVKATPVVSAKPSLFKPWAVEAFGIGAKGSTFQYVSKRAGEAHTFLVLRTSKDGATCVRVA